MYIFWKWPIHRRGSRNFSKGGWGGKFWKKNVCWYISTRQKLDSDATLSLFFLFKRIVSYLLLSFIFEIWKGDCNLRIPPSRSANAYIIYTITHISSPYEKPPKYRISALMIIYPFFTPTICFLFYYNSPGNIEQTRNLCYLINPK